MGRRNEHFVTPGTRDFKFWSSALRRAGLLIVGAALRTAFRGTGDLVCSRHECIPAFRTILRGLETWCGAIEPALVALLEGGGAVGTAGLGSAR